MKTFKYCIWSVALVIGFFYILPATLLQVPYFQHKIANTVTNYLEEKTGTEIQIQQIEFQLFNRLILKDIYIEDQSGNTLFTAKGIIVGFDFLPLFKKQFHFSSAQIYTFELNLNRETPQSPLNIQYIIDIFQKKEKKKQTPIDLNIKNLALGHGTFSYRVKNKASTPKYLNLNDIELSDISAQIKLNELKNNHLDAYVKRLSFAEKSGFEVKHLSFDIKADPGQAEIESLNVSLPQSDLRLTHIFADYSELNPGDKFSEKVRFELQIKPSLFLLKDVCSIVPVFTYFKEELEISGKASGTFNDISLTNFLIKNKKDLSISANLNLRNLSSPNVEDIFVNGNINDSHITPKGIQIIANSFNPEPVQLPEALERLEDIALKGKISGHIKELMASVDFSTGVGSLQANILLGQNKTGFINGTISSHEINMKKLLNNDNFGTTEFEIQANTVFDRHFNFKGHVNALVKHFDYKSYNYENVSLLGDFTPDSFNGLLNINSPEGIIRAEGLFLLKDASSEFKFSATASNLLLDKLNLIQKYKKPELSFAISANVKGNNIDNMEGEISFHDLSFSTEKGNYSIRDIALNFQEEEDKRLLSIRSDLLNGEITGNYSLRTLPETLKNWITSYLPSLIPSNLQTFESTDDHFSLNFEINNTQDFSHIFEFPVTFYENSSIAGEYNGLENQAYLEAFFSHLGLKGSTIDEGHLEIDNRNPFLALKFEGKNTRKKGNQLIFTANLQAMNDSIHSIVSWKNADKNSNYQGELDFTTQLTLPSKNNPLSVSIQFQPSTLVFNDSIWTLLPANIQYRDKAFRIHNVKAVHNKQFVEIEGQISRDASDLLTIHLNEVDLNYIFESLNIEALEFGGIATGFVTMKDLYKTRELATTLDVTDFSFNNTVFGHLILKGDWDEQNQGVLMKGNVYKNDSSYVNVDGIIYTKKEEISIYFDALNADGSFLRKYMDKVVQNLSGQMSGRLHLCGDLNNPTVEGDVRVKNGSFGVEFLNTTYYISGWEVRCDTDKISIQQGSIYDKYGNKATADGYVKHHCFSNFQFSSNITCNDFLIFNATARSNPLFYGTVFGTGNVTINGNERNIFIKMFGHNTKNTFLTLDFMKETDIVDYDFINFVSKEKKDKEEFIANRTATTALQSTKKSKLDTQIDLEVLMDINNDAAFAIVMDPVSKDMLSGTGKGNLRIQYGTQSPLKVSGKYEIDEGKYNFSIQKAFSRIFEIEENSSIHFQGDPLTQTSLNVKAVYKLTANLEDLDQQLTTQVTTRDGSEKQYRLSAWNNIPVNCVLLLSGPLVQPAVKFDLELPGATSDLERQVKSYIPTEDMMNRQALYLLVMGRFYTPPESGRNDLNNNMSILTSTLSTQLSNMLSSLTENIRVGTKFYQSNEGASSHTEVELLLSSTLFNNRLTINSNFGYANNYLTSNTPLLGDFDIEYKLTRSGDIRLKAFNHYNYRNYYSLTPEMTQGVGILFRRDFDKLGDLLLRRKEPLTMSGENKE
ncbi:MAG: translocation/assembly module TamB [Candidatus Azobacteroides sp.]|nr:translocation/assembly module TamB [Candidatus Azobacteroides sp.]